MISGRKHISAVRSVGNFDRTVHDPAHELEEAVYIQAGITCSVKIKKECVRVTTKTYTDFVLSRSVIRYRTGLPVVWDKQQVLGDKGGAS